MVSTISILLSAIFIVSSVSAQDYVGFASREFVRFMVGIKSDNVNSAQASSEANHFFTGVADYPAFSSILTQAEANVRASSAPNKSQISSYVNAASQAFNQFSEGPSYAPYTSYFKAHITDFDLSKGQEEVSSSVSLFYPFVSASVSSFLADPEGKSIAKTAAGVAKHFASDLGLEKYVTLPAGYHA